MKTYSSTGSLYFRQLQSIPLISEKEMRKLYKKAKKGNRTAKKRLIEVNLKLVLPIARKYHRPGTELFDLIEEGNLGLIRAIEKYNPRKKVLLSTYATYWIEQYIRRSIEEQSKTIRIPPHVWENLRKWLKGWEQLHSKLGRFPTLAEMGNKLQLSAKQIKSIVETIELSRGIGSIETPIDQDGDLFIKDVVSDKSIKTPEALVTILKLRDGLEIALDKLGHRERQILEFRFGTKGNKRLTLEKTGKKLKLSRERVRQLEKRALYQLRWTAYKMKLI